MAQNNNFNQQNLGQRHPQQPEYNMPPPNNMGMPFNPNLMPNNMSVPHNHDSLMPQHPHLYQQNQFYPNQLPMPAQNQNLQKQLIPNGGMINQNPEGGPNPNFRGAASLYGMPPPQQALRIDPNPNQPIHPPLDPSIQRGMPPPQRVSSQNPSFMPPGVGLPQNFYDKFNQRAPSRHMDSVEQSEALEPNQSITQSESAASTSRLNQSRKSLQNQDKGQSQAGTSTQGVYQFTPLGKALDDAVNEMQADRRIDNDMVKSVMDQFKKAIEKEFDESSKDKNGKVSSQSQKCKLTGECGTYNNLFYVWEFKGVEFDITNNDSEPISGKNCKLISIPHKDFQIKSRPEDPVKAAKRKKKEERKTKKKEKQ